MDSLVQLDRMATLSLNGLHSPASDAVWQFCSAKAVWIPFYIILIGYLCYRMGWRRTIITLLAITITININEQISNLVKDSVARLRPCRDPYMVEHGIRLLEELGVHPYGFFSAHAANSFGVAVCSIICLKAGTAWDRLKHTFKGERAVFDTVMLLWATMTAVSRIFVGKHFLGDVLVGILVGSLVGLAFGYLARYCFTKIKARG